MTIEETLSLNITQQLKQSVKVPVFSSNVDNNLDYPQIIYELINESLATPYKTQATGNYLVQVDVYTGQNQRGTMFQLVNLAKNALRHLPMPDILNVDVSVNYSIDNSTDKILNRGIISAYYTIKTGGF
ncbi:hypothetical protein WJM93_15675 [Lactiplantibacillus plantarum]|uniref:hypothetical protein n=1 Tax=Lactiplantibacillus plantarum TaxID=1590 RepID=UPI003098AB88